MTSPIAFIKNWTLPIAMLAGAMSYLIGVRIPLLTPYKPFLMDLVSVLQPILIFSMLFITFCKVDPHDLRLRRWHGWLLLMQAGLFAMLSLTLVAFPDMPGGVVVEGAMLCLICPTATAGAVVVNKLGGDAAGLTTYTILINLVVAVVVPMFVPLIHPHPGLDFVSSFFLIMGKVFPMLICPFFAALLVRWLFPKFHRMVLGCKDLAFYIWAVSLSIAIAVTVRSIVHSDSAVIYQADIAAASLIACALQFYAGKKIGRKYGCPISAGQSLGQKNTVFAIWMGYTFLTPVSSIAGGFYSIWHNIFNSWQLYRKRKDDAADRG